MRRLYALFSKVTLLGDPEFPSPLSRLRARSRPLLIPSTTGYARLIHRATPAPMPRRDAMLPEMDDVLTPYAALLLGLLSPRQLFDLDDGRLVKGGDSGKVLFSPAGPLVLAEHVGTPYEDTRTRTADVSRRYVARRLSGGAGRIRLGRYGSARSKMIPEGCPPLVPLLTESDSQSRRAPLAHP